MRDHLYRTKRRAQRAADREFRIALLVSSASSWLFALVAAGTVLWVCVYVSNVGGSLIVLMLAVGVLWKWVNVLDAVTAP